MDGRIVNRAIITIQVITWLAIIITMGMILSLIVASIFGTLSRVH